MEVARQAFIRDSPAPSNSSSAGKRPASPAESVRVSVSTGKFSSRKQRKKTEAPAIKATSPKGRGERRASGKPSPEELVIIEEEDKIKRDQDKVKSKTEDKIEDKITP